MTKKGLSREVESRTREMRSLIGDWRLIPGAPDNEFDAMIHKLLGHLYRGADLDKLARVIESELTVNYGFFTSEFEANSLAVEIYDWWKNLN